MACVLYPLSWKTTFEAGKYSKGKPSSDAKCYIIIRALLCYQQQGAAMGSLRRPKLKQRLSSCTVWTHPLSILELLYKTSKLVTNAEPTVLSKMQITDLICNTIIYLLCKIILSTEELLTQVCQQPFAHSSVAQRFYLLLYPWTIWKADLKTNRARPFALGGWGWGTESATYYFFFWCCQALAYYGVAGPIFILFTLSMTLTVLPPSPCFRVYSSNGIQLFFFSRARPV